jgi:hypothetical protein
MNTETKLSPAAFKMLADGCRPYGGAQHALVDRLRNAGLVRWHDRGYFVTEAGRAAMQAAAKTFAEAAAARNVHTVAPFASWKAPAPSMRTVQEMRALQVCEACKALAPRTSMIELAPKVKRGVPGRYIHGYCYAVRHGLEAFKNLPCDGGLSQVTLDEWCALGLGGAKYRAVGDRAKNRRGVILTETGALAAYCTEQVNEPESVLGRRCNRKATTANDAGKPVCAWHRTGRIFREAV